MSLYCVSTSFSERKDHGFALVVALSLMAFVLLLLLAITSLVRVEQQSSTIAIEQVEAEQAALLGLNVALGKLQETVGLDQRITANASVLGDANNPYTSSVTPVEGQGAWMGVWKSGTISSTSSPDYSPALPNAREFVGWLVSGTDGSGNFQLPSSLPAAATDIDVIAGRESIALYTKSDGVPHIQVEKVPVEVGSSQGAYFAFSVEDESTKADLVWNELSANSTTDERYQASRLAAAPGPDYGALNGSESNGPFLTGTVIDYPLTVDDTGNFVESGVSKLTDVNELGSAISGVDSDWLRDQRSSMTWGSKGLLTDVKYGGFRRDLSLAFEMDGESESENATNFNQQDGVFVGGNDRLAASQVAPGMPMRARYPYRDFKGSGTPFSDDIFEGPTIPASSDNSRFDSVNVSLRGPTWWLLRDYAQLYKRLSGTSGDYAMDARSYFPNISENAQFSSNLGYITGRGSIWDLETDWDGRALLNDGDFYIFRPARANYAPVSLGSSTLISLSVRTDANTGQNELAVCMDMFFYLWNPYNRKISCDNLVVAMDEGISGNLGIWITSDDGAGNLTETAYHRNLSTLLNQNLTNTYGNTQGKIPFLIKDETGGPITLEPGEIVIASPSGTAGEANLGFNINSDSGIIMTDLNGSGISPIGGAVFDTGPVPPINLTDTIEYVYVTEGRLVRHTNAMRHELQLFLPDGSLNTSDLNNASNFGEELQLLHFPWHGGLGQSSFQEFLSPESNGTTAVGSVSGAGLLGAKQFIGATTALMKPASWQGNNPNPVEVFSQFNPNPIAVSRDLNRIAMPNMVYNMITDADPGNLLNNYGISYSGSVRNAFWGLSYDDLGSTRFPMSDIPSSPLISLASLASANASVMAAEPFQAIGNSWSHPFVPVESTFGQVHDRGTFRPMTAHDLSWQMNDALFDRYYFSGIAPAFTISGSGYSTSETLTQPLQRFYQVTGSDYRTAKANPMLVPYVPSGMTAGDVVNDLDADDGYLKMGAYSLINGAFNVNSTSVDAWTSLLRANRGLVIQYAEGGTDSSSETPFPGSTIPSEEGNGADPYWSGYSRLTDTQIADLAEAIVEQVKLRGPFMSLSDFVNRRVGTPVNNATHYSGALQAAIDLSGINQSVQNDAGGIDPVYSTSTLDYFQVPQQTGDRTTATGIPGEINQAELLLPLAPRLTARSDTFRIRAYGEVRSPISQEVVSKAVCEVVVQRLPEYIDPLTDADNNEPWDEATDPLSPSASALNQLNQQFGRRLKIVQMRWLPSEEI